MTRITGLALAHGNFRALAEDRVLQLDGDVGTKIGAALGATAPASPAEGIAKPEEIAKDLAEILE